jgi:hypothetical protein
VGLSRALIECFAGTALGKDVKSAFDKLEGALSPAMKTFLDRLPRAITARQEHAKRQGAQTYEITARLLDAILGQRVTGMHYQSLRSRREKPYGGQRRPAPAAVLAPGPHHVVRAVAGTGPITRRGIP